MRFSINGFNDESLINLYCFKFLWRIFHSYKNVTNARESFKSSAYARPLSRDGS